MIELTQEEYEEIVFLTRCAYYDLPYPTITNCVHKIEKMSGLRLNVFNKENYVLIIICGTDQFRDWIANCKVKFNVIPKQFYQALSLILKIYKDMDTQKPLILAGHSLGGSIAQYCASLFHDDTLCITFNGYPVKHLCSFKEYDSRIINIYNKYDIVNILCKILPTRHYLKHLGETYIVKDKSILRIFKAHCDLDVFLKVSIKDIMGTTL